MCSLVLCTIFFYLCSEVTCVTLSAPKESVSDNVVGYVPLSKENFIMDDCEVTLIGVKGNHMPFNDNCRSKRLHLCNKVWRRSPAGRHPVAWS